MERGWVAAGVLAVVMMVGACSGGTANDATFGSTSTVDQLIEPPSTTSAAAAAGATTPSPAPTTAVPSTTVGSRSTTTTPSTTSAPATTAGSRPFEQCPGASTRTIEPYLAGTVPMVTLVAWHSERPCLVAVETATGKVIGAVYSSPEGWRTTNVVIEPTGTSLVVSEAAGCTSRLVRVDLRNGERTDLGPGSLAGLRSDGAALAYRPTIDDASFADEPVSIHDPCLRDAVVVRDVASGREQVLDGNDATESRVAWSPDGRFLAWNYYSNTDIGHALIVDLATGRFGHVELDDQRKPWVSDGECCGTQVLGWTSANRAIVRLDLYVASIEPGRSARSSIGTGAVRTDDRCGVCIVVDRNITRDDPDHAGDLGKAGTTTLRKWGNGWQTVGPGGVVDLPGASALWPVSATFPSFEPDSP